MADLFVSEHPVVRCKLTILRSIEISDMKFRSVLGELAMFVVYEATQDMAVRACEVQTPLAVAQGWEQAEKLALIPIMRAGMSLEESTWRLLPNSHTWHLGLFRHEKTLEPVHYYNKLPTSLAAYTCFLLDPMLATGGSAVAAVDVLKRWGAKKIKLVGILAAPEGIKRLHGAHPDVPIHVAAVDERLNERGYILPGLGDVGDRCYGTH